MAEKVLTLYFEDTSIKLLVAKGRKVESWAMVSLEPGLVTSGTIVDETKTAGKIKELLASIKANLFSNKGKVIVGLSGRDSLYRVITLPVLEKSMLAEAVRREAGRVLPVSLDQLYLAYKRIPGNDNETRVFVAAYPKKSTDILIKTLRLAGVTPRVLDTAPLALCLAVNEPRAIIADVKSDSLNIMVLAERVPQVIRSLSLQSEGKTISGNMTTISEEFSRTVAFYNSSHQQAPIDSTVPVFVSGDLATAQDAWPELVGKLNSKVAILPIALEYPENFPVNDFVVNLGLATKELGLEKLPENYSLVNLNALPSSFLPQAVNPFVILVPVVAVVGIIGVIFMWNTWQKTKNDTISIQSQVTAKQNLITSNNKAVAALTEQNRSTLAQIQPIKDAATVLNNKLNSITAARTLTDSEVHQIIALKPGTVEVLALTYNADNQTVNGTAGNQADVLSYAQALRDAGGFTTVVSAIVYSPTTDPVTGAIVPVYNFTFQMK